MRLRGQVPAIVVKMRQDAAYRRAQPHKRPSAKIEKMRRIRRSQHPDRRFEQVGRVGLEPTTGGL
jgi:hypothetical protein